MKEKMVSGKVRRCYSIGLDVGSTTAKIAVMDDCGNQVYSRYGRHNARVNEIVGGYFNEFAGIVGDADVKICVTGSVGMATAELLKAEFVQEVVAATVYAERCHPEARALIDIGGEDAKVVFFKDNADGHRRGNMELRMNGNCAGGTGAFIDQMSVLLGVDNRKMSDLAMQATHIYPIAARCGVFAKTDIQNLMSRNLPVEDIAASIFHSIAVQTVVTLSHGITFTAPILLCGGPFTFLPALRKAFSDYMHLAPEDFIVTENSNLVSALGCACRAETHDGTVPLSVLQTRLRGKAVPSMHCSSGLEPLFKSEDEHSEWVNAKARFATAVKPLEKGRQRIVLGIDSGSTTTKIVALRLDGGASGGCNVVFVNYAQNLGNPVKAAADGLEALKQAAAEKGADLEIVGGISTGYGEDLVKAAFGLDGGIVETMAHERAAASLMPDVSFILDIGGQDMKAIFVEKGAVVRMELNEACSSGCGTFIQTFANNLGYSAEDFAQLACTSKNPCDLGTRCTVFMNSKVKQVLREGASVADISAGIAYSVIKNCLYKVLKLHGNESLGDKIVVQGGTMRNDAVVRAFELLTHTEVARSNMPEMMGAYGCALHAASEYAGGTSSRTVDDMLSHARYETGQIQCRGCENRCYMSCYTFADGSRYFSGNRCEKVFNNKGKDAVKGENVYPFKYRLLFDRPSGAAGQSVHGRTRIGIPRVLNMYEDYPFWNALLRGAGIDVVLSSESSFSRYEGALNTVMSDNICFPAKLAHSHLKELDANGQVDRILMPYVVYERNEDPEHTVNSYNCPVVSGYSDVIRSAMGLKKPVDSPVINFSDRKLLKGQILDYLKTLGVGRRIAEKAFEDALEAQAEYCRLVKSKAMEIYAGGKSRNVKTTILLAGRPYHTDPLVQHKLSGMIAGLGVDVISDDIVRAAGDGDAAGCVAETLLVQQWAYMNRILRSAQWVAEQGDNVHFVMMTSFGCGPDSFIQDEIRDILKRHGKPFTLLKIDDVSNTGSLKLRVRSLVESLCKKEIREERIAAPLVSTEVFRKKDAHRKILAPFMTEYLTQVLPPLMKLAGYDVEVLPMSDEESAELGLKYANNEICYPATLIVGDVVKALKSGRYDLTDTAVAMSQTGGQCRATNYAGLIKRAMVMNGFKDVPLLTLGVTLDADRALTDTDGKQPFNEQDGFDIPWLKYSQIAVTAILYCDAVSEMYNACIVRERRPGAAGELRDKYMRLVNEPISRNSADGVVSLLRQAAEEFDGMTEDKDVPRVGIVGEIFLKFNPFSHQFLEKHIISRGIEIVPPLLAPFFLQEFVNMEVKKNMGLSCSRMPGFVIRGMYKGLVGRRLKQVNEAASRFRYFRKFTDIYDDAENVDGIVSLAAQFGEGWLLPADVVGLLHDGVNGIISLQPFGCIANHVISKGIEKRLHEKYPQLNLLSLDFDSGVSEVNIANRLLLFLDGIAR